MKYQLFIDGQWRDPVAGRWFETANPYTGEVWAEIPRADAADVELAVAAAHQALANGDSDTAFLQAKQVTARFYADHILSKAPSMRDSIVQGADSVTDMALEAF